jgi:glycosyltransferase involved in cell wall biosynthesis
MRIIYHHRTRSTDAQRIHIREIANAFTELGHEVEIVSLVPTEAEAQNASRDAEDPLWQRTVRRIPFAYELVQLAYNFVGIPMLLRRVLQCKAAFIYERYSLFNFTGVLVAKLTRRPLILEVNSPFALEQARDKQIRAVGLARWTERAICSMSSKVIVVSTPLRDIMLNAGVHAEKLVVMPNGVRKEMLAPRGSSKALRSKLGLQGKVVIGFIGWLRPWHGLEFLIEAFEQAQLQTQGSAILIIGDGPAMPDLCALVDKLGLHDHVVFTGPLPHESVPEHLDAIDIAVQPAANEYCCPMKILEYMALGKAIVAPRQSNICDLLHEDEAALFEPGNKPALRATLQRLVTDTQIRKQLAAASSQALQKREYYWTRNATRVLTLVKASGFNEALAQQIDGRDIPVEQVSDPK